MITLEYKVPVWNEKKHGYNSPQHRMLGRGYLKCLKDMGVASYAKIEYSGKGSQALDIRIDLLDVTKEAAIDARMRKYYAAISPEEYKQLSRIDYERFLAEHELSDLEVEGKIDPKKA